MRNQGDRLIQSGSSVNVLYAIAVGCSGYLLGCIPHASRFWLYVGFAHPVPFAVPMAALSVAAFVALRLLGLRSKPGSAIASNFIALLYFTPPSMQGFYDTRWTHLALLAIIAIIPIIAAVRSVRQGTLEEHNGHDYFPTLDGWRSIAVGLVVADHLTSTVGYAPFFSLFNWRGQHGVNLFFGISGFLIASKLLAEYRDRGTISLPAFYRRRVLRILPAAFLYLAVATALFPSTSNIEVTECVLFLRNLRLDLSLSDITSHFWSLSIEEQFYLCLPALLLLRPRLFPYVAAVLAVACAIWRFVCLNFGEFGDAFVLFRTDLRIDGLLCGTLLAFVFQSPRMRSTLARIMTPIGWLGALVAYLIVFFCYRTVTTLTESVLVVLLIGGTMLHPTRLVSRILEGAPLRFIGKMSYGIYLWQHLFCYSRHVPGRIPQLLQTFPMNLLATFVAALMSFYLIERPILNYGRHASKKHGHPTAVPQTEMPDNAREMEVLTPA